MALGVGSWPKCLTRRGQKNLVTERRIEKEGQTGKQLENRAGKDKGV